MIDQKTKMITHRKGDTESFTFSALRNGVPYNVPLDEIYYFTVKADSRESGRLFLQKVIPSDGTDKITFIIDKTDTKQMPYGMYVWDLRCKRINGTATPIAVSEFKLAEVVGNNV